MKSNFSEREKWKSYLSFSAKSEKDIFSLVSPNDKNKLALTGMAKDNFSLIVIIKG